MATEYRHVFLDETSNQRLSSNVIQSGAGGSGQGGAEIKTGSNVVVGVRNQLKSDISSTLIDQPLNQVTGGLWSPARQTVKAIRSGAGGAAIAGGVTAIAFMAIERGVTALIQAHEERIQKLETEAQEANNNDNLLIKAGKLNISNMSISYNKYGKATYTDRS